MAGIAASSPVARSSPVRISVSSPSGSAGRPSSDSTSTCGAWLRAFTRASSAVLAATGW